MDIIIRLVPGCGHLPIVEIDGKEVGRGSFYPTPEAALAAALEYLVPA